MSFLLALRHALWGDGNTLAVGAAVAVALVGAFVALRAADAAFLRRFAAASAVVAVGAAAALVLAGAAVAATFDVRAPMPMVVWAWVVAATAVVAALVETHMHRIKKRSPVVPDGHVHISVARLAIVGLLPVAIGIGLTVYLWSGIATDAVEFANPDAPPFVAAWLFAIAQVPLGIVGAWYLARSMKGDPRNVALVLNAAGGVAIVAFVGVSEVVGEGDTRLILLILCLALTGACGAVPQALNRTVALERSGAQRANGIFLACWGSMMFVLAFMVAPGAVEELGVPVVLQIAGALLIMTGPLGRLLPRNPNAGQARSGRRELAATVRAARHPAILRVAGVTALGGITITAAYSPLEPVTRYWEGQGAQPAAQTAVLLAGVGAVIAVLSMVFFGRLAERNVTPVLWIGAVSVTAAYTLGGLPFLDPSFGQIAAILQVFLVELGTDMYLLLVLPAVFNVVSGAATRAALAVFMLAKYELSLAFVAVLNGLEDVPIGSQILVIQAVGLLAGVCMLALTPALGRDLRNWRETGKEVTA